MSAKLSDLFPDIIEKEKNNSINFRDKLSNYLYHWPLFCIGVVVFMLGAYLYLQRSSPLYGVSAKIIIKDETKNPDDKEKLQEIDLSNSSDLAENEIEVLNSRALIDQVVSDLQLWVTYQKKTGFKKEDLYKRSPVAFKLLQKTDSIGEQTFNIIINDDKTFFLEKPNNERVKIYFNSTLTNKFGTWKLEPTDSLFKYKGSAIKIILNNQSLVAQKYQNAIKADLPDKLAPVIVLTLKDEVEQRGIDVLNDLIGYYNEFTLKEKNLKTQKTIDFIDKRINNLADELNHSESAVEKYRSSNELTNIASQSQVYLQNIQVNDNNLNEVNVQLNIIQEIERYINSSQNKQNVPATLNIKDENLNSLILSLSKLQLQRDQLLATTPEANPVFEPINRQIQTLKHAIKENIQSIKSSLIASRNRLQSYNSKFKSSIQSVPVQERQLVDKTRQQSIKENLYVYLLQKKEELSLNYASVISGARIVDNAYAIGPQSIPVPAVYALAFLLGLIVPSGFIYARNSLNNRITTSKEIEDGTGISILGELSNSEEASPLISMDRGNGPINENFRILRTNLNFLLGKSEKGKVVLITSSVANEGKSFVSSNLGIVLAASGKKTILLEMDLRRPKISTAFNLSPSSPGISDYLTDDLRVEKIIQKSASYPTNLDFIGSGHLPPDPAELLEKDEIGLLINELRSKYDFVIIDTPPINLVTDAKVLSGLSDIVLYVVRQSYTYKSLLPFIRSLGKGKHFSNMKIIFNGVESSKYGHNYGHDYYQKLNADKRPGMQSALKLFFKRF